MECVVSLVLTMLIDVMSFDFRNHLGRLLSLAHLTEEELKMTQLLFMFM